MERIFELAAKYDAHKSFYGKAHVIERDNGVFRRTWNGYSQTSERHIKGFKKQYNIA